MQLVPFVSAIVGGALTAGSIGTAIVGGLVSVGAGYLARRLQPKAKGAGASQGMQLTLQLETNESRRIVLGRGASAGALKWHNTYGPNGADYLQLVFVLADHECDGLEGVYVDGTAVTLGSWQSTPWVAGNTVAEYPDLMWIEFHNGAFGQDADADLVDFAPSGSWPSSNRGRGICYVRVTIKYSAKAFSSGLPQFVFQFRGAKLYDRRKDSTKGGSGSHRWGEDATYEWSDNVAVCLENYLRGIYVNGVKLGGMTTPETSLPASAWFAAANACDEDVTLKAGGTEKRYCMGALIDVSTPHRENIREILAAMAGSLIESGGVFKPQAGVSQTSVMTITDADIVAGRVEYIPKLSRADLVNAVYGSHSDPSRLFESTALPPRISPDDRASDGGDLLSAHYDLPYVLSGTQGQRIMEIMRRKARHQERLSLPLSSRAFALEAGDWVTVNIESQGIEAKTFEVMQVTPARDLTVRVELAETSVTAFAFIPANDELDPLDPTPVAPGGSTFTTIAGWSVATAVIDGVDGQQIPGLAFAWTPVSDETVREVRIQYRKVGDTVPRGEVVALDPVAGQRVWAGDIQGGIVYEARAIPVAVPDRGMNWTAWASTGTEAAQHIVGVAQSALSVPPNTITPEMLDEESRAHLFLVTALASQQGSVDERVTRINDKIVKIATALADVQLQAAGTGAFVRRQEIVRQTEAESFAQALTQVQAELEGSVATAIGELTATVFDETNGLPSKASASALTALSVTVGNHTNAFSQLMGVDSEGRSYYLLAATTDGAAAFFISADGTLQHSSMAFGSSAFQFVDPNGGDPIHLTTIETVEGDEGPEARLTLNGELIAAAIRAGKVTVTSLDALVGEIKKLIAWRIESPDGNHYIDLGAEPEFQMDFS